MKQPGEQEGPHQLPYGQQERCAVEGRRIDGSGPCTVIAIHDRKEHGWILYPHGNTGLGVLIDYDAAHTLANRIGSSSTRAAASARFPDTEQSSTRVQDSRHGDR